MERVAFLIELTGQRLGCMLNPESLVVRRTAGVRPRHSASGPLSGAGMREDPLVYTGGGTTELLLDLLFDVSIAGSSVAASDVRVLTRPLFELAEGTPSGKAYSRPPAVRFVWGKQWNIPGVVTAVAEKLEQFTADGAPRRSWLRMRLLRIDEPPAPPPRRLALPAIPQAPAAADRGVGERVHQVLGGGAAKLIQTGPTGGVSERLDGIAHRVYGDARMWRHIAHWNDIADPLQIAPGRLLRVPPSSSIQGDLK